MFKSIKYAVLAAAAALAVGTQVQAAPVLMALTDIHPPILGVAGFNGTNITSPGGVDDFVVTVGAGPAITIPNSAFQITSGFAVGTTLVADANFNNAPDPGETIVANIGPGTFDIVDTSIPGPAGVLVHGIFTGASINSSVGSSALTLNSANVNGLDLTAGPALIALGISSLDPSESFTIGLVGIAGQGVQVTPVAPIAPGVFFAQILPFETTSGSVNLAADARVPEPASLGLLSAGALGLLARRRRRA